MSTNPRGAEANTPESRPHPSRLLEASRGDIYAKGPELYSKYHVEIEPPAVALAPRISHERVSKPIRMRVRYTCHRCQTTFGHERECAACQHRRCRNCERYPPRRRRPRPIPEGPEAQEAGGSLAPTADGPDGHGQEEPTYCNCHECQTIIHITLDECPNCHHRICDQCRRETTTLEEVSEDPAMLPSPIEEAPPNGPLHEESRPPEEIEHRTEETVAETVEDLTVSAQN